MAPVVCRRRIHGADIEARCVGRKRSGLMNSGAPNMQQHARCNLKAAEQPRNCTGRVCWWVSFPPNAKFSSGVCAADRQANTTSTCPAHTQQRNIAHCRHTPQWGVGYIQVYWLAARMAATIRSGVAGDTKISAPRPLRASLMALVMAAGGAMAPPSPRPFCPNRV
jgi:hypothetical protein